MVVARGVLVGALALSSLTAATAQQPSSATYLSHAQASPVFAALGEPVPAAREWGRWIAAADTATRARVAQGDEDSILNFVLFGTSFTTEQRITSRQLNPQQIPAALDRRLRDFERALAQRDKDERLQFARRLLANGLPVRARMLSMLERSMEDSERHAQRIEQAHALADPSLEFAERSRLYRERGLSSDTSIRVNLAVEDALRDLKPKVRRVAIVGPGLDVIDKQEGYDFYPPQTIQPFAVVDSLIRLGLADIDTLQLTTFDVSARVNSHIAEIGRRARAGAPYMLHVPLDAGVPWTPALLDYFRQFGNAIGAPVPVSIPPNIGRVMLRAVAVRPSVVTRISALDVNITAQTLTLGDDDRFDLIVGTNVFLYYDRLQQALAMASAAHMLRPGGLLLSNNALVEVPSSGMRSIGYSKTLYSNRDEDGDLLIWYQKGMN